MGSFYHHQLVLSLLCRRFVEYEFTHTSLIAKLQKQTQTSPGWCAGYWRGYHEKTAMRTCGPAAPVRHAWLTLGVTGNSASRPKLGNQEEGTGAKCKWGGWPRSSSLPSQTKCLSPGRPSNIAVERNNSPSSSEDSKILTNTSDWKIKYWHFFFEYFMN